MNPQTSRSLTEIIQQVCYTNGAHDLPGGTWRIQIIRWRLMEKIGQKFRGDLTNLDRMEEQKIEHSLAQDQILCSQKST